MTCLKFLRYVIIIFKVMFDKSRIYSKFKIEINGLPGTGPKPSPLLTNLKVGNNNNNNDNNNKKNQDQ